MMNHFALKLRSIRVWPIRIGAVIVTVGVIVSLNVGNLKLFRAGRNGMLKILIPRRIHRKMIKVIGFLVLVKTTER